jgi:hypothetical protein
VEEDKLRELKRAATGYRIARNLPKDGNLSEYYLRWRFAFTDYAQEIENACRQIEGQIENACRQAGGVTPEMIAREIAGQQWFRERVFDQYLWSRGSDPVVPL